MKKFDLVGDHCLMWRTVANVEMVDTWIDARIRLPRHLIAKHEGARQRRGVVKGSRNVRRRMGKLVIALAKCGELSRVPIQPLIARRLMKAFGWNQTPSISLIHIKT